jgi:hypothetical protein
MPQEMNENAMTVADQMHVDDLFHPTSGGKRLTSINPATSGDVDRTIRAAAGHIEVVRGARMSGRGIERAAPSRRAAHSFATR